MPIYEFLCRNCGNEFEKILPFSAQTVPHCPQCKSDQVERQMGRPAIHFKGSGWYITDSKAGKESAHGSGNKNTDKAQTPSETSTADSSTGSETKSEAKSEAKSDAKEARASVDSAT